MCSTLSRYLSASWAWVYWWLLFWPRRWTGGLLGFRSFQIPMPVPFGVVDASTKFSLGSAVICCCSRDFYFVVPSETENGWNLTPPTPFLFQPLTDNGAVFSMWVKMPVWWPVLPVKPLHLCLVGSQESLWPQHQMQQKEVNNHLHGRRRRQGHGPRDVQASSPFLWPSCITNTLFQVLTFYRTFLHMSRKTS